MFVGLIQSLFGKERDSHENKSHEFLKQFVRIEDEQRDDERKSFHCPVTFCLDDRVAAGFLRDVSESGMGFLHDFPVDPGPIAVVIRKSDQTYRFTVNILWCRPSAKYWYISGGTMVSCDTDGILPG